MQKKKQIMLTWGLCSGIFCYLELIFHLLVFHKINANVLFLFLSGILVGTILMLILSFLPRKAGCIVSMSIFSIVCLWYCIQLVFQHIFLTFLSFYSIGENSSDVLEFWKEACNGIVAVLPGILLLLLPIPVAAILIKKLRLIGQEEIKVSVLLGGSAIFLYCFFCLCLLCFGKQPHGPYDLYYNDFVQELGMEKLGVLISTRKDLKNTAFGEENYLVREDTVIAVNDLVTVTTVPTIVPSPSASKQEIEAIATPTNEPIDTSPNVLNINFKELGEKTKKKEIASLYQYFSKVTPTNKNQYTGLFQDYNLIYLTAEGFSPYAVDEKITPTLYKLTHSGFIFHHFYNPIWWTSTSDGEYVGCTGLIPSGTNSFAKSAKCDMPLCLGWQMKELGYTTRAYHNHSYKYYHRNLTHPNIGYDYKGAKGGGLDMTLTWPESDLEMMKKTIPDYIHDPKFHVYYMTVSGHMEYNFSGNYMAYKNKEYVKDLPYSDECKAYIACNKELDLALAYLIDELEKAGVLDKTVIALSADHYPYGLAKDKIDELAGHTVDETFELYKNYFILWNSNMKEAIDVDKYCSTIDIMPTLCNLFQIPYDSRLFMGQDILSDAPALVMTSNQSFITDYVKYNSKTGKTEYLTKDNLPDDYVKGYISIIKNKFLVSGSVIRTNFYHDLLPYLKLTHYKKPKIME